MKEKTHLDSQGQELKGTALTHLEKLGDKNIGLINVYKAEIEHHEKTYGKLLTKSHELKWITLLTDLFDAQGYREGKKETCQAILKDDEEERSPRKNHIHCYCYERLIDNIKKGIIK